MFRAGLKARRIIFCLTCINVEPMSCVHRLKYGHNRKDCALHFLPHVGLIKLMILLMPVNSDDAPFAYRREN